MRIRSTKPEFWRSKTIAELDWDVRLVLKGLESYVDDNGVGKDDLALIAADVFPRDLSRNPRDTLARLSEAVSTLHTAGLIARYLADDEDLLYIDKWKDIQRVDKPRPGRFPRPDGTMEYSQVVDRDTYRNPRGILANIPVTLAPGTGEQGNRGTGEQIVVGATLETHQSAEPVAPAKKCPRHINDPDPPDCGACASARRAAEAIESAAVVAAQTADRNAREARALVVNCDTCDDFGRLDDLSPCPNHPRIADVVTANA